MMEVAPVLIDGSWRQSNTESSFQAINPATGEVLPGVFPSHDE